MIRRMLFHRRFAGYSGGHGKVWHYFQHVEAHPDWRAAIHFTADSIDGGNPWRQARAPETPWLPDGADALFLAGEDWQAWPRDDPAKPVINLIQGVRHADPGLPLHGHLVRPAIRICVGRPVADAILSTGRVRGPVCVIDAAIEAILPHGDDARMLPVFIAAQKQPALGRDIARHLHAAGIAAILADDWWPRATFLDTMRRACVAVLLPLREEGLYLPGLEAMAAGAAVVMPDAVGNRAYARHGHNALMPERDAQSIGEAAIALLRDDRLAARLTQAGSATALQRDLATERAQLHGILDNLESLWDQAWAATSP